MAPDVWRHSSFFQPCVAMAAVGQQIAASALCPGNALRCHCGGQSLDGAKHPDPRAIIPSAAAVPYLAAKPLRPLLGVESVFLKEGLRKYSTNVPDDFEAYDAGARGRRCWWCRRGIGDALRRTRICGLGSSAPLPAAGADGTHTGKVRFKTIRGSPILVMNAVPEKRMANRNPVYYKAIATEVLDLFSPEK